MNKNLLSPAKFEQAARKAFNRNQGTDAQKSKASIGRTEHEFDLYDEVGSIAGGISTSPWRNKTGTNNTGGQDRQIAELLWLSLCTSIKRKALILRDKKMAEEITQRFGGSSFFSPAIEIWLYDDTTDSIRHYRNL